MLRFLGQFQADFQLKSGWIEPLLVGGYAPFSPLLLLDLNIMIMYSSEDLERFYFQYKTEALPHGESIQNFCVRNKVPYNIFSKWYKDTRKKIVEVKVDGMPSDKETLPSAPGGAPASVPASSSPVRILVEIRMSNGLHISQKNLSYHELVKLVEKLEGLC